MRQRHLAGAAGPAGGRPQPGPCTCSAQRPGEGSSRAEAPSRAPDSPTPTCLWHATLNKTQKNVRLKFHGVPERPVHTAATDYLKRQVWAFSPEDLISSKSLVPTPGSQGWTEEALGASKSVPSLGPGPSVAPWTPRRANGEDPVSDEKLFLRWCWVPSPHLRSSGCNHGGTPLSPLGRWLQGSRQRGASEPAKTPGPPSQDLPHPNEDGCMGWHGGAPCWHGPSQGWDSRHPLGPSLLMSM